MIYRAFLVLALLCFSGQIHAAAAIGKAAIKTMVRDHLTKIYAEHYGPEALSARFQFHISNLDNRLKLSACSVPVDKTVTSASPLASQVSVRLACTGLSPWAIYVPVRVDSFATVAVASRSLHRGQQLTSKDINFARVNTTQLSGGYFEAADGLIGMELKRGIRAGATLTKNTIKAPTIVKRGETVSLEATAAGIAVITNAKALSAGKLGQQIRVQNLSSKRLLSARVIGPGRVQVAL